MPLVSFCFVCETETKPHKYAGELPCPQNWKLLPWLSWRKKQPTSGSSAQTPNHLAAHWDSSGFFPSFWSTKQLKQVCNQCRNFLLPNSVHTLQRHKAKIFFRLIYILPHKLDTNIRFPFLSNPIFLMRNRQN